MDKVVMVYIIIQLLITAFGLAVIESVRPIIEKKLHEKGYYQRNRNSLYNFNDTLINIAKGFIPGYYFVKALKLVGDKKNIDIEVNKEIKEGNYVKYEPKEEDLNTADVQVVETKRDPTLAYGPEFKFEEVEPYKARKNEEYLDLYSEENPIEYIERVTEKEEDDVLTPFINNDKVVEQVVVKEDVSKSDIAKAIAELDVNELKMLSEKLKALAEAKEDDKIISLSKYRNDSIINIKDVA